MQKEAMLSLRSSYFLLTNENVFNLSAVAPLALFFFFFLCALIIGPYELGKLLNS